MEDEKYSKIKMLVDYLIKLPDEKFNHIIEQLLTFVKESLRETYYDLVINVNASAHHNVYNAILKQFAVDNFKNLTEGTLSFEQMLKIPELVLHTIKNSRGRIGIVLTGHPLMQLLALATTVASYGKATAFIWLTDLRLYFTKTYEKFKPTSKFKPIKNNFDIIIPTKPLSMVILDELKDLRIHIVCSNADNISSWNQCYNKTISLLIGNPEAIFLIDAPKGLPATIATEIIECLGLRLKALTFIDNKFRLLELDHKSFRDLNFEIKLWSPST